MLADFLKDYLPIILFLIIALGLSILFIAINYLASPKNPDPEKLSAYECGFEPFNDSRMEFDVRFYLVAILFIIFDLEVAFLFPWAITLGKIGIFGFWSMIIFLGVLTIGFRVAKPRYEFAKIASYSWRSSIGNTLMFDSAYFVIEFNRYSFCAPSPTISHSRSVRDAVVLAALIIMSRS